MIFSVNSLSGVPHSANILVNWSISLRTRSKARKWETNSLNFTIWRWRDSNFGWQCYSNNKLKAVYRQPFACTDNERTDKEKSIKENYQADDNCHTEREKVNKEEKSTNLRSLTRSSSWTPRLVFPIFPLSGWADGYLKNKSCAKNKGQLKEEDSKSYTCSTQKVSTTQALNFQVKFDANAYDLNRGRAFVLSTARPWCIPPTKHRPSCCNASNLEEHRRWVNRLLPPTFGVTHLTWFQVRDTSALQRSPSFRSQLVVRGRNPKSWARSLR